MNVILIGYRATGKTSVGRCLAETFGFSFHDTDEEIVKETGSTIRELVAMGGWDLFRRDEKAVVASLSKKDRCVLSLGGGAVMDPENVRRLHGNGVFVWLRADAETIMSRMQRDEKSGEQRPPLSGGDSLEEVYRVLCEREEVYRKVAHWSVETSGKTIEEVAGEIAHRIRDRNPSRPPP